jgi:hypothetical protein
VSKLRRGEIVKLRVELQCLRGRGVEDIDNLQPLRSEASRSLQQVMPVQEPFDTTTFLHRRSAQVARKRKQHFGAQSSIG